MRPRVDQSALLVLFALWSCSAEDETEPAPTEEYPRDAELRVNQLQVKGTHNSYHIAPTNLNVRELNYTHIPLERQLAEQGVRQFELDTTWDEAAAQFLIVHINGFDEGTTCRHFVDCLSALRGWSQKNPAHHLLFVQIEPKDTFPAEPEIYFDRLHSSILTVWPRNLIVTPDDVKADAASVREAIATRGWPTLDETRGKNLFFMDNASSFRQAYTHGDRDLAARLMFVNSTPGAAYEAVYVLNHPINDAQAIAQAIAQGFLVRTRADADNQEPFAGDTARRDAALASGAQFISTDYPAPVAGVNYVVDVPNGTPSRCNPVTAPPDCSANDIENPEFIH